MNTRLMILTLLALFLTNCEKRESQSVRIEHAVNDYANVLSPSDENELSRLVAVHRDATGVQIALLTVSTTDDEPIDDFSHRVASAWGGGQHGRDNGVLVTLAINDHRSRIEVGRGLEASLTDGTARQLLDEVRPALRGGDYLGAFRSIVGGIVLHTGALSFPQEPVASNVSRPVAPPRTQDTDDVPVGAIVAMLSMFAVFAWFAFWPSEDERRRKRMAREQERSYARKRRDASNLVSSEILLQPAVPSVLIQPPRPPIEPIRPLAPLAPLPPLDPMPVISKSVKKTKSKSYGYSGSSSNSDSDSDSSSSSSIFDSSSSSSDSSSSDSGGSDWGGDGGGFDGGGSSGDW